MSIIKRFKDFRIEKMSAGALFSTIMVAALAPLGEIAVLNYIDDKKQERNEGIIQQAARPSPCVPDGSSLEKGPNGYVVRQASVPAPQ